MSAQIDRFVHDGLPPAELLPVFRYDLPELQFPDQLNLVEELLDKAGTKGFGDKPMLRSPTRTLTYAQAAVEVNRIAQVLTEDLGLVPGNRVLLRGGNSIPMALAWLAVVKAGLIAVATMPLLRVVPSASGKVARSSAVAESRAKPSAIGSATAGIRTEVR